MGKLRRKLYVYGIDIELKTKTGRGHTAVYSIPPQFFKFGEENVDPS